MDNPKPDINSNPTRTTQSLHSIPAAGEIVVAVLRSGGWCHRAEAMRTAAGRCGAHAATSAVRREAQRKRAAGARSSCLRGAPGAACAGAGRDRRATGGVRRERGAGGRLRCAPGARRARLPPLGVGASGGRPCRATTGRSEGCGAGERGMSIHHALCCAPMRRRRGRTVAAGGPT